MAKTVKKQEAVKTGRTLLLSTVDGDYRITIPPGSRVTFGPTIPYQKKDDFRQRSDSGYSLRVYESVKNDSLIAVFGGVNSFRDISMPHAKLIIREAGKSVWKSDEDGYKVEQEVNRTKAWDDPLNQLESGK